MARVAISIVVFLFFNILDLQNDRNDETLVRGRIGEIYSEFWRFREQGDAAVYFDGDILCDRRSVCGAVIHKGVKAASPEVCAP